MPGYNQIPAMPDGFWEREQERAKAFFTEATRRIDASDTISDRLTALTTEVRRLAEVVASKDGYVQHTSGLWVPAGKGYTEAT